MSRKLKNFSTTMSPTAGCWAAAPPCATGMLQPANGSSTFQNFIHPKNYQLVMYLQTKTTTSHYKYKSPFEGRCDGMCDGWRMSLTSHILRVTSQFQFCTTNA